MLPVVAGMLQPQGIKLDLSMLPPQNADRPAFNAADFIGAADEIGHRDHRADSAAGIGDYTIGAYCGCDVLALVRMESATTGLNRRSVRQSINNMKMIMLAMHNYHDANKRFPPAYKADKEGKPLLSWRVLILPMIEQADLYNQFHLDEPWDSENNKKLIAKMPAEYRSPNSKAGEGKTNYLTVRGENTVFPGKQGVRIADITDGTSFTIAIVEASDEKAVIWTKPDDFEYRQGKSAKRPCGPASGRFSGRFCRRIGHTFRP